VIIQDLIDKLLETGTPFSIVDGANALAEVDKRPPATPAAYVYVAAEASGANQRMTGPVLQRSAVDIAVMIVTENLAGRIDAARDIETLKGFVRGRFIGLVPVGEGTEPIEHVEGKIVSVKDGMVWFEDVFGTAQFLTEQN
jgi:hypothetical protein